MNLRDMLVGAALSFLVLIGFAGLVTDKKDLPIVGDAGGHPTVAVKVCEGAPEIIRGVGETTDLYTVGGTTGISVDGERYWLVWQADALIGDPVSVDRSFYTGSGPTIWAEQIDEKFAACFLSKPVRVEQMPHVR